MDRASSNFFYLRYIISSLYRFSFLADRILFFFNSVFGNTFSHWCVDSWLQECKNMCNTFGTLRELTFGKLVGYTRKNTDE